MVLFHTTEECKSLYSLGLKYSLKLCILKRIQSHHSLLLPALTSGHLKCLGQWWR